MRLPKRSVMHEHIQACGWDMQADVRDGRPCFNLYLPDGCSVFVYWTLDELWAYWRKHAAEMVTLDARIRQHRQRFARATPRGRRVMMKWFLVSDGDNVCFFSKDTCASGFSRTHAYWLLWTCIPIHSSPT